MARKKKTSEEPAADAIVEQAAATPEAAAEMPERKGGRPKGSKNKASKPVKAKAKGKGRMRYDAATKAKILAVSKGKKLSEAHEAATKVGYKGSVLSLYQMLYALKGKGKGRKPGRPKGSKNTSTVVAAPKRRGRPAMSASNGLSAIDQIVAREVQSRINAAARAAIAELEKLIS